MLDPERLRQSGYAKTVSALLKEATAQGLPYGEKTLRAGTLTVDLASATRPLEAYAAWVEFLAAGRTVEHDHPEGVVLRAVGSYRDLDVLVQSAVLLPDEPWGPVVETWVFRGGQE